MRNYSDAPFFWNKFVKGWFWSGVPELRILLIFFFHFRENGKRRRGIVNMVYFLPGFDFIYGESPLKREDNL